MKRVFCVCAALIVAVTPAFAWNAESFVSDGLDTFQVYEYDDVASLDTSKLMSSRPMMFSAGTYAASSGTATSADFDSFFTNVFSSQSVAYTLLNYHTTPISSGGIILPSMDVYQPYPLEGSYITVFYDGLPHAQHFAGLQVVFNDIPTVYDGYNVETVLIPSFIDRAIGDYNGSSAAVVAGSVPYFDININLEPYVSFTAFSLDGHLRFFNRLRATGVYNKYTDINACQIDLIVNGQTVDSFYPSSSGVFDCGSRIYSFSSPVTSLCFRARYNEYFENIYGEDVVMLSVANSPDIDFEFSVLSDTSVIDGFNDEAQNNINEHEALESQWTGSMTSNFNALNLDDFTIPDGLVSGFALISGIFNDLWNGMGEFKIVYVFPLTLGVVLLLIGRISKFSGGHGSAKRGRSDDNA